MLDCAIALRARGLSVIPIPLPDDNHDGKVPVIAWREYQSRLPTVAEVHAWFDREPKNVAVITGEISGVVVVDADSREAMRWCASRLPYTPWQVKTARGWHLFYRYPGVRVTNRARVETNDGRIALDVRGDGGFVIAPPSLHSSGVRYVHAGDWSASREQLPVFWPGWLRRPERPAPRRAMAHPTGVVIDRARSYLKAIPRPEIGAGSDAVTLYAACRLVRGFGLTEGEAIALLWQWAGGRPGWTFEWLAQKVRHAMRYGTEPIGALR